MTEKKKAKKSKKEVAVPLQELQGESKLEKLQALYNQWYGCRRCMLGNIRADIMGSDEIVFGSGNPNAGILVVGEAPGDEEERTSEPFTGPSGKLLNQLLAACSDSPEVKDAHHTFMTSKSRVSAERFHRVTKEWRDEAFFFTNVVSCKPPENRQPTPLETAACWERLWNLIYVVDPLVIVAVGRTAAMTVLKMKKFEITKQRGQVFDAVHMGRLTEVTYPVVPVLHPSYLLRVADWTQEGGEFEKTVKDWRSVMSLYDFLREQHLGIPRPQR